MPSASSIDDQFKVGSSLLSKLEKRFIHFAVPKLPAWLCSHHLTLASLPISLGIIFFSYLGRFETNWLWVVNVLIFGQWLTDSLDGALGRYRKEGLIKWGYYMDHLFDYFFLCSILIGYSLQTNNEYPILQFFVLAICSGFMVNSFLAFGATQQFKLVHLGIGPTELRILFIIINTLIIAFGKTYIAPALPFVLAFCFIGLCVVVYHTQKELWQRDMEEKDKSLH
jgi:phosphatidylglycerophosphate synthase